MSSFRWSSGFGRTRGLKVEREDVRAEDGDEQQANSGEGLKITHGDFLS